MTRSSRARVYAAQDDTRTMAAAAMAGLIGNMRVAVANIEHRAKIFMYTTGGEGTTTLPGMPSTATRAHNLGRMGEAINKVCGTTSAIVTDTEKEISNMLRGKYFSMFEVTVPVSEKHLLLQPRFDKGTQYEYCLRVDGLRNYTARATPSGSGSTTSTDSDATVEYCGASLNVVWCDGVDSHLTRTDLFRTKKWHLGAHDGKTRMLVYVLATLSFEITEEYAQVVAQLICEQFKAMGQVTAEFDRLGELTRPGGFEIVIKFNGELHSTVPGGGYIWDGRPFEGMEYGKVKAEYRPNDLCMHHRCFRLVNSGHAEFPVLTSDHEQDATCGRPRGERGGRGRGRGRARGGGRQHVVLNLGGGARGRGAGGGMMQAIGEVGAEVTAPPRRVRPRPDSMDDDQLLDGVEGI